MRRILLVVALALVGVVAVVGVGAAGSGGETSGSPRTEAQPVAEKRDGARHGFRGHGRLGHGMLGLVAKQVLASSAGRLGVAERELRVALRAVGDRAMARRFAAANLTTGDRAALKACHRGHHRRARGGRSARRRGERSERRRGAKAGCDRRAARAAVRKLKASKDDIDLAAEKQTLAADLAKELELEPAKVLEAARAELVERLGQAVGLGLVSEKGRELALSCFDAPARCDIQALRAELKLPGHGRRRHG